MNRLTELHLHIDGSIRPSTVWDLAHKQNMVLTVPNPAALEKELIVPDNCTALTQYLERFTLPLQVLQQADAITRVTYELAEDLAAENITCAELRFAPGSCTRKGLKQEEAVEAAICGVKQALLTYPHLHIGLILCCMRGDHDIDNANKETIRLAAKYLGNVVCAVDLAGAEALYPTSEYEGLFREASLLDIPFTIHAGEAAGPESVRKALSFGACRIGHGIRAIEDPALVDLLVRNNITLEICPKSNFDTKCFSDPNQYPLRSLFDAGVPVTLNSDNRTVSDTSLRKEIAYVQKQYHFTDTEIQKMQEYAKEALFLHL